MGARCEVCSAPVVQQKDATCAFCRSPVAGEADPQELLDYLAERLPKAQVGRKLFGRGKVSDVRWRSRVASFRARLRGGEIAVEPDVALTEWVEMLVGEVSKMAASNPEVRRTISRSGWAFR